MNKKNKIGNQDHDHYPDEFDLANPKKSQNFHFHNMNPIMNSNNSKISKRIQEAKRHFQKYDTLNNFLNRQNFENNNLKEIANERKSLSYQPYRTEPFLNSNLNQKGRIKYKL